MKLTTRIFLLFLYQVFFFIIYGLFISHQVDFWFFEKGAISDKGILWLKLSFLNDIMYAEKSNYMKDFFTLGVGGEKNIEISYWTFEQNNESLIQQEKQLDYLPLYELFGYGVPSFLSLLNFLNKEGIVLF